ncbi:MAG: hypothetical protein L0Y44_01730 [Phycisphaerales bacterium]|nr:hypothetical protein [Phycisphaerales bacterium]MCI0629356.1 hypothetical protein [Phycisphaerales bacterium]MCI0674337.1 hypothetical protein [Phycisphaerales bacterium]
MKDGSYKLRLAVGGVKVEASNVSYLSGEMIAENVIMTFARGHETVDLRCSMTGQIDRFGSSLEDLMLTLQFSSVNGESIPSAITGLLLWRPAFDPFKGHYKWEVQNGDQAVVTFVPSMTPR